MDHDSNETRLKRIESKLRLLVVLAVVQSIVIALLVVSLFIQQFMPSTPTLILLLIVLAVLGYVFRKQIPSWFGRISRLCFSQLVAAQKSDSMKDIN